MKKGADPKDTRASSRKVILRPRLVRLLEESTARVTLLAAPAGYGKTTLARQWAATQDRPIVWYQATSASADVAALALGLEQAFAGLSPTGDRANDYLRLATDPEGEAVHLAQLVAADISALPASAMVFVDDYHYIVHSRAAEQFMSALLSHTSMPLVIATRIRPTWVTAKDLLYGEILELGRNVLAMTHDEADKLLDRGASQRGASGLVALAEGWPAVIGLAALLPEPIEVSMNVLPDSLHGYFAEELYQGMPGDLQWNLAQLSLAPKITTGLARELFGESGSTVLDEGYERGFLTREPQDELGAYELHPLLRQFLRRKLDDFEETNVRQSAEEVGRWYLESRNWDATFTLAAEFDLVSLLRGLVGEGIDPILADGRLSTVDRWLELGRRLAPTDPVVRLAEVEATFRRGRWREAQAKAIHLADELPESHPLGGRVLLRAGQIAQLDDRLPEALDLFTRASLRAQSPSDARRALWGRFITLSDSEEPERAWEALAELERLPSETVEDLLRASQGRLHWAIRWGGIQEELDRQAGALELILQVPDPLVRTGFLQTYGTAVGLAANYAEGLKIAEREVHEAESSALRWVKPHALELKGLAQLGLRDFEGALESLNEAYSLAAAQRNLHSQVSSVALMARVFLSRGEKDRARQTLSVDWERKASAGMEGDYLAVKALTLACCDESEEALRHVRESESVTNQIDGRVLRLFVLAVLANRNGADDADQLLTRAVHEASSTGNFDAFVSAYRAEPSLLERLRALPSIEVAARRVLCATDPQLAEKAGFDVPRRHTPTKSDPLTPREQEVLALLRQGLTNREIARSLWIEESTVKVHVRHILKKLGVRTRTAAVAARI
jgi:LuxR family transcriptional regulator, maltose regulon positive regulatory protein